MNNEPLYIISVVSRVLKMHPQTLRKYERAGLVRPSRTEGMLRLYSDDDLARLRLIKRLVDDLGLNVAGVGLVLQLVDNLEAMEQLAEREGANRTLQHARAVLHELGLRPEHDAASVP
ncbi:MAG: MerR family transcriptional regulator [Dehalococcoidia bacterium]